MNISYRLQKIAERVEYRTLADIGTDHALLPVYLCKNGKIDFAVASDVKIGPLQKAEINIERYGLTDKIETRIGSGLSTLLEGECETLVMAGIGGLLTIELLNAKLDLSKNFKQLILQPQRDIKEVRMFLVENGFTVCDEEMLVDGGKFYTILDCSVGQDETYTTADYYFGKALINKKDPVLKEFLNKEMEKTADILNILENSYKSDKQSNNLNRINELEDYCRLCGEVLECL